MTLYIVATSFEERSRAILNDLGPNSYDDAVLVIDFLGYENVGPYLYNRNRIMATLEKLEFLPKKVEVEVARPLAALDVIRAAISQLRPEQITLDISVLPKTYLFGLCRLLLSMGIDTKLRYYKPSKYGKFLSRGIGTVSSISGFEGEITTTGELYLAIVLGFEGYKALHVWESIGPTKCTALVGTPPYRDEFLAYSKESNKDLLGLVEGTQFVDLHTFDVQVAISQLKEVHDRSRAASRDSSFVLCPLGTKLQSLACFGLAYCNPEITVATVSSLTYYSGEYSWGIDPEYTEIALSDIPNWANSERLPSGV